ncbi:tyrosine--tRNA ligase [Agrococcus sp. Marseille-Q4369]|uniref:tyrosine--tRNA ligase n=1 Tax=Agrococcus sp. Marseille-Q4369 TaxID=2810513 RepID=UPI001B8CDE8E|nr:tyrosine--tRNA ligase [Agrococcus sp. Marseille-Q4369]QUW20080.1 tyrosine--tRNA ligase [Agrococcus sp. Marseille-Q4369]
MRTVIDLAPIQLDPAFDNVWDELQYRGSVHVSTDPEALRALLGGGPITYYCGFDPTAPSLHLGNLAQLIIMRRLQLAGHKPLALVGGSTGLIGDPKPTAERQLNERETVAEWVTYLGEQMLRFLSDEGDNAVRLVNNLDWTGLLSTVDFLREVGKHFRVGTMLRKDAVASRMESDEGISYAEFSYQVLQGLDFRELFLRYGCIMQLGGSDQWGNLTAGTELIRKAEGVHAHALGSPLITDADGRKFGKSEGNAVWLDANLTTPYAMYQFWLNQDDAIVVQLLKSFTFLPSSRIAELERATVEAPFRREAQRELALQATAFIHGREATEQAIAASEALFGAGDLAALDAGTLAAAVGSLDRQATATDDAPVLQLLQETGLVDSLSEGRRAIAQGGVSVNNERIDDPAATLEGRLLHGRFAVLRRGKKTLAGVDAGA